MKICYCNYTMYMTYYAYDILCIIITEETL
nr:MAG TPA: hypothetical protein [Caudoviricetes sp.]